MKRTFRILLAFYGVVIILTASCRKSGYEASIVSTTNNTPVNYTQVNQLFGLIHPVSQTLQVSAGTFQTLRAAGGTLLKFYPYSFKDNNGNIIKNGIVSLQITEVYSPGLMVANRTSEFCNGSLFQTGGQVNIVATMNGQVVNANKYGIGFKAAAPSTQSYSLFYGVKGSQDSLISWNSAIGVSGTTAAGTVLDSFTILSVDSSGSSNDTMTIRTNYNMFDSSTSFNWISCSSFFASGGHVTNITVMPADTVFNSSNTIVYLLFPDINSAAAVNNYYYVPHAFSLMAGYEIPVGMKVDLIAIANISGNYYFYEATNVTVQAGQSFYPSMAPATLTEIEAALSAL